MLNRKVCWTLAVMASLASPLAIADIRELISEELLLQIAEETSGEAAKRNLDTITLQHRMRASSQFDIATQHIVQQLKHYGLDEQKSRPVWDVRFAQLWEVRDNDGELVRVRKLGDWDSVPLTLAQDSLSADVTTSLVDIGTGMQASEYEGKDIKGKLVLTSSQPGAVADPAGGSRRSRRW